MQTTHSSDKTMLNLNLLPVSIIIPVYNGESSLAETITALQQQTSSAWEAIVIDDGSTDGTLAIAQKLAQADSRIRVITQENQGVSAARNAGIRSAQFDWLLFLDADDWVAPSFLERLTNKLMAETDLDLVYCDWDYMTPDGDELPGDRCHPDADLFQTYVIGCPFAIHACIVRRQLVEALGYFDTTLKTCEDRDLWQRVTRSVSRIAHVPESLAFYRIRFNSLSRNPLQNLLDGMDVIQRAHRPDPRVPQPQPRYANGISSTQLPDNQMLWLSWTLGYSLGLTIGSPGAIQALLDSAGTIFQLDPVLVARGLFEAAIRLSGLTPDAWIDRWQQIETSIEETLSELETRSQVIWLQRRTLQNLEALILSGIPHFPQTLNLTHGIRVEVTQPIPDISVSSTVERLYCQVEVEGCRLGVVELPICNGSVPSSVLKDAIAHSLSWELLRHYCQPVYRQLTYQKEESGISVWRGSVCLARGLTQTEEQLHDRVGWTVFLQELWGLGHWVESDFYRQYWKSLLKDLATGGKRLRAGKISGGGFRSAKQGWISIEISQPLPVVQSQSSDLNLIPTLGGVPLGVIKLVTQWGWVSPQAIRRAIVQQCGLELITAALREGCLGNEVDSNWRDRLAVNANSTAPILLPEMVMAQLPPSVNLNDRIVSRQNLPDLALARHPGDIGTSASRRAVLPHNAEVNHALALTENRDSQSVAYLPELILRSTQPYEPPAPSPQRSATAYDRSHFETLFATKPDPWKYTNAYEQTKYEQTLELLPDQPIRTALEIACAEGHFTIQLAPRVESLLAMDISEIALERTADRCATFDHIQYQQFDIVQDSLPGTFDLVVCSEVLYFLGSVELLKQFATKVANSLNPGGYFLTAHANLVVDDPGQTGYNWDHPFGAKTIGETFAQNPNLSLVKAIQTPLYRIQLFQHQPQSAANSPEIISLPQPTPPPDAVVDTILWNGGQPNRWNATVTTSRLPILMYHRVAAIGSHATARYRVTPEAFEAQLRYLRDAGFYSVRLEEWQQAVKYRSPLPGRAILLTFDDAYQDFLTEAFPLLKRYGFSALVFVVTDAAGRVNHWDQRYGETLPLLNWDEILQLQSEGIEFGSHTASHAPLTSLSPTDIVREGMRSRTILEQKLGRSVQAIAYPYGDQDQVVRHLMGACGYLYGLTCRSGLSSQANDLLDLPRLEVRHTDTLADFVAKLQ
jgi:peptidoglycan/xylan/chitin deacetylase (PgdA/CDA1 family)